MKPSKAQWGTVGLSLMLAKTSMLQKMGKMEATKYTSALVDNNKLTKYLLNYYDNIIKTSKKFCQRVTEYSASGTPVTDIYRQLALHFSEEKALGQAFQTMSDSLKEVDKLRDASQMTINSKFVVPIEHFFDGPLADAREAKKRFRKAMQEFDASESKLREAQNGTNPQQLYNAYHYQHKYKRRMMMRQHEAEGALADVLQRHNYEFLVYCIEAMSAQYDFYCKAYAILYDLEGYFNQLKQYSQNHRAEYAKAKNERLHEYHRKSKLEEEEKYDDLVKIFSSSDLVVVNAICVSAGADQDVILEDLVRILDAYKYTLPIIKIGITKEVQSTASAATLFRGNSTATKLMTAFTRLTGRPYLVSTMQPLLQHIISDPKGYEVDPAKIKNGETVEVNTQKLTDTCNIFIRAIFDSLPNCPIPFREMAQHLQAEVIKRFPDNRHTSVGGFIFLRFFCPVILSPDANGLVDSSVLNSDARRALILISKVLQNLANGIQFGAKESYMNEMNKFITDNITECRNFLDELAVVPTVADYTSLATIEEVRSRQLPSIHKLLIKNLEKISKSLVQNNEQAMIPVLVSTMGQLGEPEAVDAPKK